MVVHEPAGGAPMRRHPPADVIVALHNAKEMDRSSDKLVTVAVSAACSAWSGN